MRIALACALLASLAAAQDMKANLEQKMAKAFVKNAAWITDYDAAKAKALQEGKLIFGYFTRSYQP